MSTAQGRPRPQETVGSERNQGVSQVQLPTVDQIDEELQRTEGLRHRHGFRRNVMFALVGVFAASVLVSTFVLPTFRIYGQSMSPTLNEGDIVVATKSASYISSWIFSAWSRMCAGENHDVLFISLSSLSRY